MMIGRSAELKYLNTYYDREGSQIMVVYGEKNIGKTALLNEFVQDKQYHYYRARSASEREQLYQWGRELGEQEMKTLKYPSYTDIFQAVMKDHTGKKVIIIDEFQYIIKTGESFIDELVKFVHGGWHNSEVMVILCSSSVGWVENSLISRIGTAAYELSGFLKVKELDFEALLEYFPGFDMEKSIEAYAILGGVPGLWRHFSDKLDIKENIIKNILDPVKYLYGEGQRIVEEELRETGVYNTILASIAAGSHKLNDLYLHTEFSRAKISVYLKNLMELELVEKVFSYDTEGKANVQKGIYRITNHFVHFYFTFLYPHLSSLESMTGLEFYNRFIGPNLKTYVSDYYIMVCAQRLKQWNQWDRLPFRAAEYGEWVGKFGNIDIIVKGEKGETLLCLCNFEKPMMRYDDYEWLLFCARKARLHADYVYLFSVSSFDEKLTLEGKVKQNLKLITLDEM
jgi:hypothetical protein